MECCGWREKAGLLFRSSDGGQNWTVLDSPYHGSFFDIAYEAATGALLVVGLRGNIFRSLDNGESWQAAGVDTTRSLAGVTWLNERYAAAWAPWETCNSVMTAQEHSVITRYQQERD